MSFVLGFSLGILFLYFLCGKNKDRRRLAYLKEWSYEADQTFKQLELLEIHEYPRTLNIINDEYREVTNRDLIEESLI